MLQVCFKGNIDPFPSCLFQQKQEVEGCFFLFFLKECFNVSTCSTLFFYSWHTCQAGRRPSVLYFITLWVNLILNVTTVPLQCCLILAIKHKHILPLDQSGFPYTTFIFMLVLAVCILSLLSSVRCLLLVCLQQNIKFH